MFRPPALPFDRLGEAHTETGMELGTFVNEITKTFKLRAGRIANRLHDMWGGKTKAEYDFPPKPKRMRWTTYQRLLDQYDGLQNRWGIGMMSWGARRPV